MHHSIEIEHLSFTYPDGHRALEDVSLFIQPGEKVALVGPNGAGKSTLILHLNGILSGLGRLRVCGLEVNKGNLGRVRGMVGLVFQIPDDQLFSPTVYDDVAFARSIRDCPRSKSRASPTETPFPGDRPHPDGARGIPPPCLTGPHISYTMQR